MTKRRTKRMRGRAIAWASVALALAGAFATSCTPGSEITAAESDLVATLYDKAFDFGGVQSYAMPDSILHVTGDTDNGNSTLLSRDHDAEILAKVASELDALGWTRRTDPNNADVIVLLAATASVQLSAYTPWYGYWDWYYPYQPGWSWYYPYPVLDYDYTLGTLAILMSDPASADPGSDTYSVRWVAAINGVLDDSDASKQQRVSNAVAQAFDQSPYLAGR